MSRDTKTPRINEEYITQSPEEIEGRVTKKVSHEFSTAENWILGALLKLDDFLLNLQVLVQSGTIPGTSWNINRENEEHNDDRSHNDAHLEMEAAVI